MCWSWFKINNSLGSRARFIILDTSVKMVTAFSACAWLLLARPGEPAGVEGLVDIVSSPVYSTAVGLVLYGHYNRDVEGYFGQGRGGFLGRTAGRVSRWLGDLF